MYCHHTQQESNRARLVFCTRHTAESVQIHPLLLGAESFDPERRRLNAIQHSRLRNDWTSSTHCRGTRSDTLKVMCIGFSSFNCSLQQLPTHFSLEHKIETLQDPTQHVSAQKLRADVGLDSQSLSSSKSATRGSSPAVATMTKVCEDDVALPNSSSRSNTFGCR